MLNKDYRYTNYEEKNCNRNEEKKKFIRKLEKEHPGAKNHYILICKNEGKYKLKYLQIFDNKCAYCGNSLENISIYMFEIDHYINMASFTEAEEERANQIENLFPACKICNSKKSGITFKGDYINLFNPDTNIQNVFYRDEQFNIKINKQYCKDNFVIQFYTKLRLDHDARRLDYLLLCMRGLANKISNLNFSKELTLLIDDLQKKRNYVTLA